jgi:dipeptidyl aminopeptidase/acylaminoacyl peptidase
VGNYLKDPSNVQAIVDYFGATDLNTILAQSTPFRVNMRKPALELLLGVLPEQNAALAKLASPVTHMDKDDPPLLIFHGDQDPQMPINQSHELTGRYKKLNLDVHFEVIYGAAHGGDVFLREIILKMVIAFLNRTLSK